MPQTPDAGTAASPDYTAWLGREEERAGVIAADAVEAMAATLDLDRSPQPGEPLPPGWHWMYFNPVVRRSGLGPDGHPKRGGFLPPIDLPRRMWAGSRIRYLADIPIGAPAVKRSRIAKIENKTGKRGPLWFVTVEHTLRCEGRDGLVEEQDIVYREAPPPGAPAAAPTPHTGAAPTWTRTVQPDATLLFRYSALTFNGHRIHYDQDWCRQVEGYPDLVVHGPLTATLLQGFALDMNPGRQLASFEFRGVSPLHPPRAFRLEGEPEGDGGALALRAIGPDGELAVAARAQLR